VTRHRVDPLCARAAARTALVSAATRREGFLFASGHPPDDARERLPIWRQAERALEQIQARLAAAGSSLERIVKCNVYCTDPADVETIHAVYGRYFSSAPVPVFICVGPWPEPFDLEIDCVATLSRQVGHDHLR
jgi:2-iminobutanoate/2-iminopropanoate deaminase